MPSQTIGVDLGKSWFQIAVADDAYRIQQRRRLNRSAFQAWLFAQESALFVMEACGSSQHWARLLQARGHSVKLLPAQYVKAYVRRSKHDAADAAALVEASRCEDIRSVSIKTIEQQVLLQLHRLRTQWQAGRTARICALRECCGNSALTLPRGQAEVFVRLEPYSKRRTTMCPISCGHLSRSFCRRLGALSCKLKRRRRQCGR